MENTISISTAEYKELVEFKVRAEIQPEIDDLKAQLQAKAEELHNQQDITDYWYKHCKEVEEERNALKVELETLKAELEGCPHDDVA